MKAVDNRTFLSRTMKDAAEYTLVFVTTALLLLLFLYLAAKIPRELIRTHSLESAEYLYNSESFGYVIDEVKGTQMHRYADSILLNIAWSYDEKYTLRAVMLSAYHYSSNHKENENYLMAVRDGAEPNQQYLRYWHGSIAIVRPLLCIMSIRGIYILNGVVLLLLFFLLMYRLLRKREYVLALGIGLGLIVNWWCFIPLTLEYTWVPLVSLVASLVAVHLHDRDKSSFYGLFFMIIGIVTIFLDFLTTETLSLTLPLLLILWLERKKGNIVRLSITAFLSWSIGYVGMWVLKWGLTALVFQENVLPYVSGHISERIGGGVGLSLSAYLLNAVSENMLCTFPACLGLLGKIVAAALIVIPICAVLVFHRVNVDKKRILVWAMTGLLPLARFIVMHNHSYLHAFFTYRALTATVFAFVLIIAELLGPLPWRKKHAEQS